MSLPERLWIEPFRCPCCDMSLAIDRLRRSGQRYGSVQVMVEVVPWPAEVAVSTKVHDELDDQEERLRSLAEILENPKTP